MNSARDPGLDANTRFRTGLGHSLDYPNHVNPTEPRNFDEWVIVNMKNEMCKEVEISKVREVKCTLAQPK